MIRHFLLGIALALVAIPVLAAETEVSDSQKESGYYGRIDIGGIAKPEVIYAEPIIIDRPINRAPPAPIYLRVPPGNETKWRRYCKDYQACGIPVYFVSDKWFNEVYFPRYRERLKPPEKPDIYYFNGSR